MDEKTANRPRAAKVLAVLLIAMTGGAIVLMALGNNPPAAGPFCLSSYYRLDPVERAISSKVTQSRERWSSIEIYYSGSRAGNIEQLASLNGLAGPQDINCHFVVCNGLGGSDGQVLATEKWQRQWSIMPGRTWYGSIRTIRICVIADDENPLPTNLQIKRTQALVEALCRKFEIALELIYYPADWQ